MTAAEWRQAGPRRRNPSLNVRQAVKLAQNSAQVPLPAMHSLG